MVNLKSIGLLVITIVGSWLIMTAGENLLDKYFPISDWWKFGIGIMLAVFGYIKLR